MKGDIERLDITSLGSRALLLDASTVNLLTEHVVFHALTGPYFSDRNTFAVLHSLLSKYHDSGEIGEGGESDVYALNHALSFLEQWMLADEVVVDRDALDSLAGYNGVYSSATVGRLSELFRIADISNPLKRAAADNVVRFFELMSDQNNPLFGLYALDGIEDLDLPLKDKYYSRLKGSLGVSGNVPARALFYLELSGLLRVPLLLHPKKANYLKNLSTPISDGIRRTYENVVGRVKNVPLLKDFAIPIPPIADEILRVARDKKCSLLDAAQTIHKSDEMRSLREAIWELSTFASGNERVRYERELSRMTAKLTDAIQSRVLAGSRISRRSINLAEMPAIGTLFKVLGGGQREIPDVILLEKPYVAVFSRWANEVRGR